MQRSIVRGIMVGLVALGPALACGEGDDPHSELFGTTEAESGLASGAGEGGAGEDEADDQSSEGGSEDGSSGAEPPEDGEDHVCEIGEIRPCDCPDGMTGQEVCVDVCGVYSACGCPTDPDVYEEPEQPEPTYCGDLECAPMVEEQTEAGAEPCCTADGMCGGQADFIFGSQCVERFGDPGDLDDLTCPDEFPPFLDLDGCCRPDGMCGLSIDYINNWDIGCIERTEMMELLNADNLARTILAILAGFGTADVDYAPIACSPG
ncbi:MAG: hypothetical protein AAGF11_14795 [Myxococcota bacterium]